MKSAGFKTTIPRNSTHHRCSVSLSVEHIQHPSEEVRNAGVQLGRKRPQKPAKPLISNR
jgi:hypothetical protein